VGLRNAIALPSSRPWAALGLGALGALGAVWLDGGWSWPGGQASTGQASHGGAPALWLCDRGAKRVVALDRQGFVVDEVRAPLALEVAAGAEGGLWILQATARGPRAPRRLTLFPAERGAGPTLELARAWGLEAAGSGVRLLAGVAGEEVLLELSPEGSQREIASLPGASRWCSSPAGSLVVLGEGRRLELLRPASGAPVAEPRQLEGACLALAPAPEGWYILEQLAERRRLSRLGAELERVWSRHELWKGGGGLQGDFLLPSLEGGVWVLGRRGELARFDGRGELRAGGRSLQGPVLGGCPDPAGGCWLFTPGGCLAIDVDARPRPGQGGFVELVDACAVPR